MLIVFEGMHSAGKTTQARALTGALRTRRLTVVQTAWNSSPPIGRMIGRLKTEGRLGPIALVLMEAADLALRYEAELRSALEAGAVVVSDRYWYSTMARAVVRGVDPASVASCFGFAPRPDLVFHLRCSGAVTLARRRDAGLSIAGHLSGEDYLEAVERRPDFIAQQDLMEQCYETLLPETTVALQCTASRDEMHRSVMAAVERLLPTARSNDAGPPPHG